MNTISDINTYDLEIKKSKFIGIIYPLNSVLDVKFILEDVRVKYPNAKHYTYAYIFDNVKKMSDDKEPSKTAGSPILNVLEKNNLNRVCLVVVRYFGGILLGASLLTRSYSNTALETVKSSKICELVLYDYYFITFSYDNIKDVDFMLDDNSILYKEFLDVVRYKIRLKQGSSTEKLEKFAQIKKIII